MSVKKTLVIVESPAKAKTIEKYLGKGYTVLASMGHLIDLPKSRLAVDVDKDFEPEYITVRGKAKTLKDLQSKAAKSDEVLLASDNDREGEAISYHIRNALLSKRKDLPIRRIVFNEITPEAIRRAIETPGDVSIPLVNAQKARRILDRIVGYHLSPLLWSKVKNGLSAGRVQSVALRIICEREIEVEGFVPEEYWTLDVQLGRDVKKVIEASLVRYKDDKAFIRSEKEIKAILEECKTGSFAVTEVKETEKSIKPQPPFTTSKLQQTAANRLGFTSRKTMQIAQQLYEGVDIGGNRIGLITYMRTDSTRIANSALAEAREFIAKHYPKDLPEEARLYAAADRSQDAHEAIRPTYVTYTPDSVKEALTKDQHRLYSLIWERFVASQMANCRTMTVSLEIGNGAAVFRSSATRVLFKGFQNALKLIAPEEKSRPLPHFKQGEDLTAFHYETEQHFTAGPARFTDATIIKTLEENGIGRPSTYAPIISVLLDRYYVVRKSKQLVPTQLGRIISRILSQSFPELLNVSFTASMEEKLDRVEEDKEPWVEMLRVFWKPFKDQVDHVNETLESIKGVMDEPTEFVCEKCGKPMVKKLGRFGFFLACSGFPACLSTRSIPLAECPIPDCGGKIVARRKAGGRGKEFYGCTNYPTCTFVTHYKPLSATCPQCGRFLVEKQDRKQGAYKMCINPDCNYLHVAEEIGATGESDEAAPDSASESATAQ